MADKANRTRIVRLEAQNVKRLRAVEIRPDPDGNLVVVGGRNGQGKTSVLDAITYALGGASQLPTAPIRRGEDKATIVVEFEDLIVKRTITPAGGTLIVENREGMRYKSPQAILDAMVGRLTFDPLAFTRMAPKEQVSTLRGLVGLDFTKLDANRAKLYAERTTANALAERLRILAAGMPRHADAPAKPVGMDDLTEKRRAVMDQVRANDQVREKFVRAKREAEDAAIAVESADRRVKDLEKQLTEARGALLNLNMKRDRLSDACTALREQVDALNDPTIEAIDAEAQARDKINAKVADNARQATAVRDAEQARDAAKKLTDAIDAIDAEKQALLASAPFPVEGLGFDANGVTFNGIPFDQASAAEQLRVSVAMGLAANPKFRVMLVRDGSLLDPDSLALLAKLAADAGAQVWMEVVGKGQNVSVVIEDGAVESAAVPAVSPVA